MNTRRFILSITIMAFLCQASHAQFLKKLKQKAEQAVEDVVVRKTADKAAQMAEKNMDKIFNVDFKGEQVDPSILPESYDFEWKYTLRMEHKQGDMNMTYYLKQEAKYFASQPELEGHSVTNNMVMVFDQKLDIMAMFMDTKSGKSGHLISNQSSDADVDTMNIDDYTFTEIGAKTILGYECQGFQIENEELKMTMYLALEAPISFNQVYGSHMKTTPKGFNSKWLEKAERSIVMEMEINNKKKKKYNAKMTCIALEKSQKTLVVSDYKFMDLSVPSNKN